MNDIDGAVAMGSGMSEGWVFTVYLRHAKLTASGPTFAARASYYY